MKAKKDKTFQIRISDAELKQAQRLAQQNKMTLADYIRTQIFEQPIKTVQSTLDLYELRRQGELLKLSLKDKRIDGYLEEDIKRHLQLFQEAIELWMKANQ